MNRLQRMITSIREIELYQGLFYLGLLLLVAGIILGWVVDPVWRGFSLLSTPMIWMVALLNGISLRRINGFESIAMTQVCLILMLLGIFTLRNAIPLP